MKKLKSGIYGLNSLLDGGINLNSTTAVIGASGAGKTMFAIQFIRRGLEEGQDGIFVSLDESKDQIIEEAVEMGWKEIVDYIDNESLIFIDATGKNFTKFVKEELPGFSEEYRGASTRVAIDPLTPVMWSIKDLYERREIISDLIKQFKKIGTIVCTLEEHGSIGDLSGDEVVIPMYLADCVIHLRYLRTSDRTAVRNVEIVKCRNSMHSDYAHSYVIIKGFGLIILKRPGTPKEEQLTILGDRSKIEKKFLEGLPLHISKKMKDNISKLREHDLALLSKDEVAEIIRKEYERSEDSGQA